MRRADRMILLALPLVALLAGFYFLGLAPKREQAAELSDRITALQDSIASAEAEVAAAQAARDAFPENYTTLVKLGKAVPEDDDQASLIYELAERGLANDVQFRDFEITSSGGTAPPPPPTQTPAEAAEERAVPAGEEGDTPLTETPAAATEATAATLPIGATVGPAGLPVMPYGFRFLGNFFDIADFFASIDRSVRSKRGEPAVNGRLITIDGFSLTGDPFKGFPSVKANFAVTTYVVPPEQGLAAGATPSGPPPAPDAEPTPVSSEVIE